MGKSATLVWCPHCEDWTNAKSIHASLYGERNHRQYEEDGVRYHQRTRECLECYETFYTAELAYADFARLARNRRGEKMNLNKHVSTMMLTAAKKRGFMTIGEMQDSADIDNLKAVQIERIMDDLARNGIVIVDEAELDAGLSELKVGQKPTPLQTIILVSLEMALDDRRKIQHALENLNRVS